MHESNFLFFRSFEKIIINIFSFEKDLLRLEKDERIMKSVRMSPKCIIKTRLKFFPLLHGNKFLFLDNFGSKINVVAHFACDQKQLILQNDPFLR